MSYPPDIFGLLQEIRDTLNTNNDPTSQYDASEFGLLHNIRDLLNTDNLSTAHYTFDINGLLTNIRDLLNTGNASTASYPPDQYGLWQSIRDFANGDNASVASYPDSIFGLVQATRDFLSVGGSGYVAKAVHFDGTVSFGTASLSAPSASGIVLISIWEKADSSNDGARQIFMCDGRQPGGAYASAAWIQANATPFFDIYLSDVNSNSFIGSGEYPYTQPVGWHHFLIYGDLDHADPDKIFKVYRDDVDVTFSPQVEGPAFLMTWNGKPFDIGSAGDTGNFLIGDLSNFRIIVPSSPLNDESGGLPEATRRLFISAAGKPVDPAVATAAALGTTIVNLSGDADSYAGAFTASPGSVGSLTNATTSPSD